MQFEPQSKINDRRYDLDWLRVIAFGLLIFYHIGMLYVSWDWHVKSQYANSDLEPLMQIVNPWRLALLFFISGIAVRFASDKAVSNLRFAKVRLKHLGLPILLGMTVVVAPQAYLELRQANEVSSGFTTFWPEYLNLSQAFSITTPTWNHLWYIVYLLVYILMVTPLLPILRSVSNGSAGKIISWVSNNTISLIFLMPLPFVFFELTLSSRFPVTHALIDDWANHAHRFTIFLMGYFVAKHAGFWAGIVKSWPYALATAICICAVRLYLMLSHPEIYPSLFEMPLRPLTMFLLTVYAWSSIVALLGISRRWLNQSSRTLSYLTNAVFFYYIMHQTIIIIAGYMLTPYGLNPFIEFSLVLLLTLAGCGLGYEILRRLPVGALFFGIRQ
ncbi:acyltransferase family protein [Kordiimonas sp. SCSIO 12603]|uniref:acyltransferase family protein n=1 Tax=Kordiimonas sp. SCSIO 12603 TaxID=2829596 RepID=UPI0021077FDB|nr:acyltransferase family protein [Kordiimonas sp. SCSIO 12603]UTW58766.1 acyltransferase family protein [Kordiimonas sp. SCSIO 12603]